MPVRINQKTFYGSDGALYLETELVSRYRSMREQLRTGANRAAEAAARSLRTDLKKSTQSGELFASIKVNKAAGGTTRRQSATASVGENVEHTRWFFEGTGLYGPKNSIIYPVSAKKMGPIAPNTYRSGNGPKFLGSSKGQKPNTQIILKAQKIADKKANSTASRLD